ncbi:MAG: RNA methyltransferase [Phycisphaerae bacterium]|nr:RNA methyltransferase [Gemmatimonadaceae bacterium]
MKLLTLARDLQRRKARERTRKFVAEGVRTVESLLDSSFTVTGILAASSLGEDSRGLAILARAEQSNIPVQQVSDAEFASSASTDTPQGVLAVGSIPDALLTDPGSLARYLVLDALQDPGNVGTVIRTAAAFGVTATICLPGTVDVWNAKVVRSAMGTLFSHSVVSLSVPELLAFLTDHKVECWAADTEGDSLAQLGRGQPRRLALVVSNEGAGLSSEAWALVTKRVSIPMAPGVESLNVAVATGILLHALRPEAADVR